MDQAKSVTNELSVEDLAAEAMKLLTISLDELYVVLGCQLLGSSRPARVADIMGWLATLKKALEAKERSEPVSLQRDVAEWAEGANLMSEELRQDGVRFLDAVREDLRKGLCNADILSLADQITASSMQIVVLVVAAILRMPVQVEPVSATVAAIVCKTGLKGFCR